ncbi:MAG: hypothetical protein SGBAC_012920 [Bacillariaceae sp.]
MLSKQHLANPGLRYRQARRDPGEAPPPAVAPNVARPPSVASRYMSAANPNAAAAAVPPNRNAQDVWVNNVNNTAPPLATPDGGVVLKPAFIQNDAHPGFQPPEPPAYLANPPGIAGRPPSRISSRMSDDSDFYASGGDSMAATAATPPPQPGAVRMPGVDGQLDTDTLATPNSMGVASFPSPAPPTTTTTTTATIDPYHHVVAQAVDDSSNDILDRVATLEEDLKKSYMMLSAHSRHGGLSTDGSDADTDALRQRVKDLEKQLANGQSAHSRMGDSDEFANASPSEGLTTVTAVSSRVMVAPVVAAVAKAPGRDAELGNANSEDDDDDDDDEEGSKGMPMGVKCLILLILLGGVAAAVFFLVPFGGDDEATDKDAAQVNPPTENGGGGGGGGGGATTDAPGVTPTLSPTDTVVALPTCPSVGNSSYYYVAGGSKGQTYSIDCSIGDAIGGGGDVSAIQIDRVTCEPSCAFLLERSAYEDLCVSDIFAFDVPDEYFMENIQFELGHLDVGAINFTCANAAKYIIPDPTGTPSMAPTTVASENPTLAVLIPTEPPSESPTIAATPNPTPEPTPEPTPPPTATPPPTPEPTPEPTPPPTEPEVDRLDAALNRFFPGDDTPSESSAEYRALEWAALSDSRNADVDSVEFRERFTLANLFYATGGESWTVRSGWTGGDNHCNWDKVTCSNGQVSELDLRENNINGPMIKTWENLALISRLRMSDNGLTGTVPTEIGSMSNLVRLELSQNSLNGEFPTHIGQLAQLTNLQIRNNSFRGEIPTHLGRLNRLRSFVAEFNQFTGQIPDELSGMTSLRNIYLGRNQLAGPIPASFGSFAQLTLLSISENRLSGALPAELGLMTNLQRFSAAQNQLSSSIPDDFGAWTAMTYLSVFDNELTGTIPSSMSRWVNTDTIYFYETSVTGSMSDFCSSANVGESYFEFYAECGLECSCCTHCCTNQNCQSV